MSDNSKYEIVDVFWSKAGAHIQVVKIPECEVEEKLALLSMDHGISRLEFESFLVSKCLIDMEGASRKIAAVAKTEEEELELIKELITHIVEVNPVLNPDLLVLTKNNLIKIPSGDDKTTTRLVDNPRWLEVPKDPVDTIVDDITNSTFDNINSQIPEDGSPPARPHISKTWEDAGIVLHIVQYDEGDTAWIFSRQKSFAGPMSYKHYVMSKCVVDYTVLMVMIDSMGISKVMKPDKITDIIYDYCIEINPFLDINITDGRVISFVDTKKKMNDIKKSDNTSAKSKSASSPSKKEAAKEKKSFSSIPPAELLTLGERIKERLIGQDEAVDSLVEAIQVAGAGLRDPGKPIGSFIFAGETGCGKTYCAKVLAKELCGDENAMVRIDCSEYAHGHEISKLIGSPPGYIAHDSGGQLTNKIIENPFSIVLLDEVEKGHSRLFDLLLQLMDEGRLTDNKGTVVDFSDCIVIMTSNIGVRDVKSIGKRVGLGDIAAVNQEKKTEAIDGALRRHFKPEFLNRIDNIVTFNSLGKEECHKIVNLMFKDISGYLTEKKISVSTTERVRDRILEKGFSKEFGARSLKRTIEKDVIKPLALDILRGKVANGTEVLVDYVDEKICFEVKVPE